MDDKLNAVEAIGVTVTRGGPMVEEAKAEGYFTAECIGPDGKVKWRDVALNTVVTEGKNYALDAYLQTGVTIVGPFMGLISSVSFTAINATDVAAQINGTNQWKEAGSSTNFPFYTTPRKTAAWSAASGGSKALSAALVFPIVTNAGTIKGAFLVLGTGASSTIASTTGVLYSAGLFTGGDRAVLVGDTVNVSYTASL